MNCETPSPPGEPTPAVDPAPSKAPRRQLDYHKRYDNIDGTGEILMGMMLLGFALLNYLQTVLPKDSLWRRNPIAMLLFMYAVVTLALAPAYWLRHIIKKHITWPRTGYVAGHSLWRALFGPKPANAEAASGIPTRRGVWGMFAAIALVSAAVAAGVGCLVAFEKRHLGDALWLGHLGYVLFLAWWVLIYAFWVWRMGRGHAWKWLLILLMTLGLVAIGLMAPGNFFDVTCPVMLLVGVVWVLSGLGTLCLYLRRTHGLTPETK